MKAVIAIFMGLFSGFMIYMMAAMIASNEAAGGPSGLFVAVTFFGGWALTSYLLLKDAVSVSKVFSRGFLFGAAEWFAMILVGIVFAGKQVSSSSSAELVGSAVGGGIFAMLAGGVSLFMTILCLVGFVISHFLGREMKAEKSDSENLTKCPSCAELIQKDAVKCRFCNESLQSIERA
jgi:uncharacterized membrane protein